MDSDKLIILLPYNKFQAWSKNIQDILVRGSEKANELETLIGRLGHLGAVIPFVYHFLSRLRERQYRAQNKHHPTSMSTECRLDLGLMLNLLQKANKDVDINLVLFRRPTHI